MTADPEIKSVGNAFAIVEYLAEQDGARLSDLTTEFDLAKSTLHDHLSTLRELGYVTKDEYQYRPSLQFLRIGGHLRDNIPLYHIAKPELKKVAKQTGEHASLMVEQHGLGIYLYSAEGEYPTRLIAHAGTHTWLHTSAPGKAIMAHLPDERVEEIVGRFGLQAETENTITDPDKLEEELSTIRQQGYALDHEEGLEGLQGVAKPILSRDEDTVIGGISVYGPPSRTNTELFEEEILKSLERAANVIELNIEYEE